MPRQFSESDVEHGVYLEGDYPAGEAITQRVRKRRPAPVDAKNICDHEFEDYLGGYHQYHPAKAAPIRGEENLLQLVVQDAKTTKTWLESLRVQSMIRATQTSLSSKPVREEVDLWVGRAL